MLLPKFLSEVAFFLCSKIWTSVSLAYIQPTPIPIAITTSTPTPIMPQKMQIDIITIINIKSFFNLEN